MRDRAWIKQAKILMHTSVAVIQTPGMVSSLDEFKLFLERTRPDSVRLVGGGHRGTVNYPSKIGPGAGDDRDLRARIEVAQAMGVKVFGGLSGVGNRAAGDAHPEWVRIRSDGEKSTETYAGWQMDLLSDYVDAWFLPQLEEMLRDYEIDGFWVDGDCWYYLPSYSERALKRFQDEAGLDAVRIDESAWRDYGPDAFWSEFEPTQEMDAEELARFRAWMAFNRKIFREFQAKTGNLCHRYGAVYTSNGTHSVETGPDSVPPTIDFISHDIPHFEGSGCFMASMKARFNDTQGVPHDVMTWDHNRHTWHGIQPYPQGRKQYLSEVSSAIANGAMWHNWSSRPHSSLVWEVAERIHQQRDLLSDTVSAAEIAILHTTTSYYAHSGGLFIARLGNKPVWGASRALQLGGHHYDIINEHHLPERIGQYRLIILAGQTHIPQETIALLEYFVKEGGRLLVTGRSGCGNGNTQALAHLLGIAPDVTGGDPWLMLETDPAWVEAGPKPEGAGICTLGIETPRMGVVPTQAEVVQCGLYMETERRHGIRRQTGWQWRSCGLELDENRPFLLRNRCSSGEAWYVTADIFGHYERTLYFGLRYLCLDIIDKVLPEPLVRARGTRPVEVVLRNQAEDTLICHLINVNVASTNTAIASQFEGGVSCGPVFVTLRCETSPSAVVLARTGEKLPFNHEEGVLRVRLTDVEVMESLIVHT